jgi:hypothetical protein
MSVGDLTSSGRDQTLFNLLATLANGQIVTSYIFILYLEVRII